MSCREKLQKAFEIVEKATVQDEQENYEDALKYYTLAGKYFMFAIRHETTTERAKKSIRRILETYLKRAEVIKKFLERKDKQVSILSGGNGKTSLPKFDIKTDLPDMKGTCETHGEVLSQLKALKIHVNEIGSAVEDLRTQKKTESEDKDHETKEVPQEEGSDERTKLMDASGKSSQEFEPKLQEHIPRPEEKKELDEKSTPMNSVGILNKDNSRENDKSFNTEADSVCYGENCLLSIPDGQRDSSSDIKIGEQISFTVPCKFKTSRRKKQKKPKSVTFKGVVQFKGQLQTPSDGHVYVVIRLDPPSESKATPAEDGI